MIRKKICRHCPSADARDGDKDAAEVNRDILVDVRMEEEKEKSEFR